MVNRCIRCGQSTRGTALCEKHALELATCTDITAEQLVVATADEPTAWLIDQWGATHAIAEVTSVGRDAASCEVAVLHGSVSTLHAQIESSIETLPRISDRGSLNGTFVNGEKTTRTRLFDGDVIRVGDVSFFFVLSSLPIVDADRGSGRTVPSRADALALDATVQLGAGTLRLTETDQGGIGVAGDDEISFARLEFALLKALVERRLESGAASAAYVSARQLAASLDFQSTDADSENVRELVRRVRRKIKKVGLADVIQSRQGAGYRLAWPARRS